MDVAAEGRIGMSVLRHGATDVGLRIFTELGVGPVVMHVAREGAIGVSILRHRAANIRLGILLSIKLSICPVIVHMA